MSFLASNLLRRSLAAPCPIRAAATSPAVRLSSSLARLSLASSPSPSLPVASSSSSSSFSSSAFRSLSQPSCRAFSSSPVLDTPRLGLLRKKTRTGWNPDGKIRKPKTHSGAKDRFRVYKDGRFKHVKAGTNQLNRKNTHDQRVSARELIFTTKTRKLKKLMPYWWRTRRGGGW